MKRTIQPKAASCESIGDALQLLERPLVAMTEERVRAVGGDAGLGMNEVVPGADEEAEVRRGALQLQLLLRAWKPLHQAEQGIGDAASGALLQGFDAARLDALAAPDGVPFEAREAIDREPERRRVIRPDR